MAGFGLVQVICQVHQVAPRALKAVLHHHTSKSLSLLRRSSLQTKDCLVAVAQQHQLHLMFLNHVLSI